MEHKIYNFEHRTGSSVALKIFILLYGHNIRPSPGLSHLPKLRPCAYQTSPLLSCQLPAAIVYFLPLNSTVRTWHKWNLTAFVLLSPLFHTAHPVVQHVPLALGTRLHHCVYCCAIVLYLIMAPKYKGRDLEIWVHRKEVSIYSFKPKDKTQQDPLRDRGLQSHEFCYNAAANYDCLPLIVPCL